MHVLGGPDSTLWLINQKLSFIISTLRNGNVQAIKLRHPDRWLCISFGCDLHHGQIFVRALLLVHGNEAVASNVNPLTRGVKPEAVDAGNTFELRNLLTRVRVEDNQHRRLAAAYK